MSDRYDLEQEILSCWNIVDDLKTLSKAATEDNLTREQIVTVIKGLEQLYQVRFDNMFQTFEEVADDNSFEDYDSEQASLFDDETPNTTWQAPNQAWQTNGWSNDNMSQPINETSTVTTTDWSI